MAHSPTRNELVTLANANSNDPMGFLEGLSDIHVEWHQPGVQSYGFLLFHHRVVRYFQSIVNPALDEQVVAYTAAQLQDLGQAPFGANIGNVDSLAELANLSLQIETWHNDAHDQIEQATGTPMMDPAQNIFFRPFWQLHLYIDDFFRTALDQYGKTAHPGQFVSIDAVAGHIEASHHGWVPRI